jgi:hypothetical protein
MQITTMPRKKAKPKPFDIPKEVKAIARERVGPVPPSRTITPKAERAKPKHKQNLPAADPGESD